MSYIFRMPKAGEGITEGEISKWTVAVGDKISEDETIVEIQNDKLISDVPSPVSGTITKILVEEGVVANVGDPLAEIDAPGYSDSVEAEVEVEKAETPKAKPVAAKEEQAQSTYTFNLPKAGEGITEGEIVKWNKAIGDSISEDEVLLEVQNDKLIQDVPSPVSGIISKILVEAGSIANVGEAIAEISVDGMSVVSEPSIEAQTKVEETQTQVDSKKTASIVGGRVLAMPSVRQLARDLDIDISKISGSGKHGHITKADVESFKSA
ncbi:MAG TPA: biotin/lipoyl-containing protein, partial [Erysipelotrichaceae bacterium]|nr:biotin/lipoyl-containing protein [Erysipelotrichaceae bacterium]